MVDSCSVRERIQSGYVDESYVQVDLTPSFMPKRTNGDVDNV